MLENLSRLRPNVVYCLLWLWEMSQFSSQGTTHIPSRLMFHIWVVQGLVWEMGNCSNLCLLLKGFTMLAWVCPTCAWMRDKPETYINSQIYVIIFSSFHFLGISLYSLAWRIYFSLFLWPAIWGLPECFVVPASVKPLYDWGSLVGARPWEKRGEPTLTFFSMC